MAWFKRQSGELDTSGEKKIRTEGLWVKCDGCRQIIWKKDLEDNLNVCPKCNQHFRIDASTRLAILYDNADWEESETDIASTDPLGFADIKAYKDRLRLTREGLCPPLWPPGTGLSCSASSCVRMPSSLPRGRPASIRRFQTQSVAFAVT